MRLYNPAIGKFLSVDPIADEYPELTPYQFASNKPINSIDIDGLEGKEIQDALAWGYNKTGALLKGTASGILHMVAHPIDAAMGMAQGIKETAKDVGTMGGTFVNILYAKANNTKPQINETEFYGAAHRTAKGIVKTGTLAVITAGAGEVVQGVGKVKVSNAPKPKPSTKKLGDFQGQTLTRSEAAALKGRGYQHFSKVAYFESDLASEIISYRQSLGSPTTKNFALLEYKTAKGLEVIGAESNFALKVHAESGILSQIKALGIDPKNVTRIFSEIEPCISCKRAIEQTLLKYNYNIKIEYSFEYNASGIAKHNQMAKNLGQ